MRSLGALVLTVAVMALTGNLLAEEKAYVPKDNEELYGTWVNMEYGTHKPQKMVIYSDGTWGGAMVAEREPAAKRHYEITEKWTDSEGNTWYKVYRDSRYGKVFVLTKLSNSGNTREVIWDSHEYPTKIDPEDDYYRIYYRQ